MIVGKLSINNQPIFVYKVPRLERPLVDLLGIYGQHSVLLGLKLAIVCSRIDLKGPLNMHPSVFLYNHKSQPNDISTHQLPKLQSTSQRAPRIFSVSLSHLSVRLRTIIMARAIVHWAAHCCNHSQSQARRWRYHSSNSQRNYSRICLNFPVSKKEDDGLNKSLFDALTEGGNGYELFREP